MVKTQTRKAGGSRSSDGPSLRDFMVQQQLQQSSGGALQSHGSAATGEQSEAVAGVPYLSEADVHGRGRRGEYVQCDKAGQCANHQRTTCSRKG